MTDSEPDQRLGRYVETPLAAVAYPQLKFSESLPHLSVDSYSANK